MAMKKIPLKRLCIKCRASCKNLHCIFCEKCKEEKKMAHKTKYGECDCSIMELDDTDSKVCKYCSKEYKYIPKPNDWKDEVMEG